MNKEYSGMLYTMMICLGLIILILVTYFSVTAGNDEPERQKEISVILYSAGNGAWESLQEGIKRAEDDFSVNVNCITVPKDADAEEQLAVIENEIENGAEGIAVAATDYERLYAFMLEKDFEVPVVAVESGFNESKIPLISADNYEMGKWLGEEILEDFNGKKDLTVALDSEKIKRDSVIERERGLRDALNGKAKIISLRVAANGEGADAAVALHKEALLELSEMTNSPMKYTKKYGIGNTSPVVAALDCGKIEKIVFQNEFNMGYLAVETLLEQMESIRGRERENIDCYCVGNDELYCVPYERLLFPIAR